MLILVMKFLKFDVIGNKILVFGIMIDNLIKNEIEVLNSKCLFCLFVLFVFVYYFFFNYLF